MLTAFFSALRSICPWRNHEAIGYASAIACLSFLLGACTPPQPPFRITAMSTSAAPVVGRGVTLHLEARSVRSFPDASIIVQLPQSIALSSGSLTWRGAVMANQVRPHDLSICVRQPGEYKIFVTAILHYTPASSESDLQILNIRSTADWAGTVPSWEYSAFSWLLAGAPPTPPLVPVPVSPECLGQTD